MDWLIELRTRESWQMRAELCMLTYYRLLLGRLNGGLAGLLQALSQLPACLSCSQRQ